MAFTVQNAVDLTREVMNATGSGQWTDATLTTWCSQAHWQLWANLLSTNRYLKMQQATVTQDSSGRFTLDSLNMGAADLLTIAFRILTIAQPAGSTSQVLGYYKKSSYEEFPNPQSSMALPYVWYRFGAYIQLLPIASGQSAVVTYTVRPCPISLLAGPSSNIDFPTAYEPLIAWRAAQFGLVKGGSETQAARDIKATADAMESAMLQDLGRESRWPIVAEAFDSAQDWAG